MKREEIKRLIANKNELIRLKKAELKKADIVEWSIPDFKTAFKSIGETLKQDNDSEIYRTIVGNTYGFMDSHDDVHIKGIFTKSINENGGRVLHLHDHVHQLSAKVGTPLKVYEKELNWSDVGLDKSGMTTALLMDTRIEKARNENIFLDYKNGDINQHSVGMQYVKLELAVNDPEEKEEYAAWERYKGEVINIEKAEENGYFWAVTEAKLIEISCVIKGSNELTPTLDNKSIETVASELKTKYSKNDILLLSKALGEVEPDTPLKDEKPHQNKLREYLIQNLRS